MTTRDDMAYAAAGARTIGEAPRGGRSPAYYRHPASGLRPCRWSQAGSMTRPFCETHGQYTEGNWYMEPLRHPEVAA